MVSALLARNAQIHVKNNKNETALDCARTNQHPEVVKLLVAAGASSGGGSASPTAASTSAVPALLAAVRAENVSEVQRLLNAGADPNQSKSAEDGNTPLIAAAFRNQLGLVQALVQKGADVDTPNKVSHICNLLFYLLCIILLFFDFFLIFCLCLTFYVMCVVVVGV